MLKAHHADEQLELAAHAGHQEEATTLRPTPAPIDSRPDVGPMAPLQPAPLTRPPCGSYADQPVTIRF